jgi:hypothetical protein
MRPQTLHNNSQEKTGKNFNSLFPASVGRVNAVEATTAAIAPSNAMVPVAISSDATTAAAKTVPQIIVERVVIEFPYSSHDSNATIVVKKYGKHG